VIVTIDNVIESVLGVDDFAVYEHEIYTKYQELAE